MGRRSFGLSWTQVNRIISSRNARARECERINLINNQSGGAKEMPPQYSIYKIDFNSNNRVTKIEILQMQQYRTIDRYVTQDYVRHPIYSDWKTRNKLIKKSIKLTNKELENLDKNEDELIRMFSREIVLAINNLDLLPSWFLHEVCLEEYKQIVSELDSELRQFSNLRITEINQLNDSIADNNNSIEYFKDTLAHTNNSLLKTRNKIFKIDTANKNPFKYIFTFFIYAYLISDKRKNKLLQKQNSLENLIINLEGKIQLKLSDSTDLENKILALNKEITNKETEINSQKETAYNSFKVKQLSITPLPIDVNLYSSFVPLKSIIGMEYKKIIGCYVIHNRENGKCYAGQSKDVLKRLHQHFKGTVPSNAIFAEDYYLTSSEKRDDLFEVKILVCETKDELDRTEKQLIEEYDAFINGYNGTSGNT